MNMQLAVRATLGGVPLLLVGDLPENGGAGKYAAVVDCRGLDLEGFLGKLMLSFGARPDDPLYKILITALHALRLETFRVTLDGNTGWLSVSLETLELNLFLNRQMKDASNLYAAGLRFNQSILLSQLPWLDQYAAEFPELNLGIQNLGILYASGPGVDPGSFTGAAPDMPPPVVPNRGAYVWVSQNIIPTGQLLWVPPLKPDQTPGSDQAEEELVKAPSAAEAKTGPDEAAKAIQTAPAKDDEGASLADSAASEPAISWMNINKTLGPFTLAKIGGSFADNKVTILLNASFSAGGITLSLYGLGLKSPIYPIKPEFTLSGMSLSFARGPVELSGGLVTSDYGKSFFGEVLVRVKSFGLSAIGAYYNNENYKSLFVFGMLELPLGGPPAFFVTGLAAGFGYNSKINLPPVEQLKEFVLVKPALPADPGNKKDKRDILQTLMDSRDSIQPAAGESWIAAGVRFTSFEMIQSFALLTVSFGTRWEIALLGRSQMFIPPRLPGATDEPYALGFAEIDLKAVIEPGATDPVPVLAVNGVVASGSYIFAKGCRLTGGFAFYVWSSGEFVVTFGGYHPRFTVPGKYPAIGRLGFTWQVSGNLHTQGELYFALTGSGIMAGFNMQAVYQSGPVVASFLARADFLLEWKPFHYDVSISVQICIALHLNLGLFTTDLSYQVGVDLHLYGPPFGGIAQVNLNIISFSIPFGSEKPAISKKLTWNEFAATFLPPDNSKTGSNGTRPALVQWAGVTGGLIKEWNDPHTNERVWIVNPRDMEITTHSGVPATEAWTAGEDGCAAQEVHCDRPAGSVGIRPMQVEKIRSVHRITFLKRGEDGSWKPTTGNLAFTAVQGKSPKALYGGAVSSEADLLYADAMINDTLLGVRINPAQQQAKRTRTELISNLVSPGVSVTYLGFDTFTGEPQGLANDPDLSRIPGSDLLDALRQAGCEPLLSIQGAGEQG